MKEKSVWQLSPDPGVWITFSGRSSLERLAIPLSGTRRADVLQNLTAAGVNTDALQRARTWLLVDAREALSDFIWRRRAARSRRSGQAGSR